MNLYYPVYENLEDNFNDLTHNIHFDDTQTTVYSSKIIDLILRSASEIESITKELYKRYSGDENESVKFDEVGIKFLNKKFNLEKKEVYLSHPNCFLTNKIIKPFEKSTNRNNSNKKTYSWNLAYQNLKHNRAQYIEYGNIQNLIDILAALFLLNIYYKDEIYEVDSSFNPKNFDSKLNSKIFSINLSNSAGDDIRGIFHKNSDFDKSVYVIKMKDDSFKNFVDTQKKIENDVINKIKNCHQFKNHLIKNNLSDINIIMQNFWKIVIEEKINYSKFYSDRYNQHLQNGALSQNLQKNEYEAVLNKNQFSEKPYFEGYNTLFGFRGIVTPDSKPW